MLQVVKYKVRNISKNRSLKTPIFQELTRPRLHSLRYIRNLEGAFGEQRGILCLFSRVDDHPDPIG